MKYGKIKRGLLTRQGLKKKICSPRQASKRQPSAWEAPILTTGGVKKFSYQSINFNRIFKTEYSNEAHFEK